MKKAYGGKIQHFDEGGEVLESVLPSGAAMGGDKVSSEDIEGDSEKSSPLNPMSAMGTHSAGIKDLTGGMQYRAHGGLIEETGDDQEEDIEQGSEGDADPVHEAIRLRSEGHKPSHGIAKYVKRRMSY